MYLPCTLLPSICPSGPSWGMGLLIIFSTVRTPIIGRLGLGCVRSGLPCHKEELHSKKLGPVESGEMAVLFILHDNALCRLLVPLAHTFPPQWDHTLNVKYARTLHPFIGTLMIPFYIFVRNAHPEMTKRVLVPFERLGSWSLETYLLQFHIFLNRQASFHAVIVPTLLHVNMIWCMILYIACAARLFDLSNGFREIAFGASRAGLGKAMVGLAVGIGVCFGIWNIPVFQDFQSTWKALYGVVYACAACVLVAQCAVSACAHRKHQRPGPPEEPSPGDAGVQMVEGGFSETNPMSRGRKDSPSSLNKQDGAPPHAGESASSCCIRYTGGQPQKDEGRVYWLKAFGLVSLWAVGHVQLDACTLPSRRALLQETRD